MRRAPNPMVDAQPRATRGPGADTSSAHQPPDQRLDRHSRRAAPEWNGRHSSRRRRRCPTLPKGSGRRDEETQTCRRSFLQRPARPAGIDLLAPGEALPQEPTSRPAPPGAGAGGGREHRPFARCHFPPTPPRQGRAGRRRHCSRGRGGGAYRGGARSVVPRCRPSPVHPTGSADAPHDRVTNPPRRRPGRAAPPRLGSSCPRGRLTAAPREMSTARRRGGDRGWRRATRAAPWSRPPPS